VKLSVYCVGKLKEEPERAIVGRYLERFGQVGAGLGLSLGGVSEWIESRAASAQARKAAEAGEMRKRLPAGARVIALDERGRSLTSEEFASTLRQWQEGGARDCVVLIGGPDGLDAAFAGSADLMLSLGRLTLPHGLVRAVIAEQLYRAATILTRHPYHRA
jgi:23S rRNA (pseudouridine1915-N3)-methyltransferase